MILRSIIKKVALELGLPQEIVLKTYKAYWKAIREHVVSLPLKSDLTDEEFSALRPNINIPSLGKMAITLDRYKRLKKFQETFKTNKENASHNKD